MVTQTACLEGSIQSIACPAGLTKPVRQRSYQPLWKQALRYFVANQTCSIRDQMRRD